MFSMVHSFPLLKKNKQNKNQTNLRGRNHVGKRNIGVVLLSLRTKIRIFFSSFFKMCPYLSVHLHHYGTFESFAVSSVWSHRADGYVIVNTVALKRNVIFLGSRWSNPQTSEVR